MLNLIYPLAQALQSLLQSKRVATVQWYRQRVDVKCYLSCISSICCINRAFLAVSPMLTFVCGLKGLLTKSAFKRAGDWKHCKVCCSWGQLVPVWYQTWCILGIVLWDQRLTRRMANAQLYTNLCAYWFANGGSWERKRPTERNCTAKMWALKYYIELLLRDCCLCASACWFISIHPLVLVKGKLGRNSRQELVFPNFKPNCDCLIMKLAKCAHFSLQIRMQEIACGQLWMCRDKRKNC